MHACVRWTKAQGLTAALESFLSLGSSVLCWFAPGWPHLMTHLSQQFSVSCASGLASPDDTLVPAALSVLCFHPSQQHWPQRPCVQLFSAHTAHALY